MNNGFSDTCIFVENQNLAEHFRLIALKTPSGAADKSTNLVGEFYDVKKLYTRNKNSIANHMEYALSYINALNEISEKDTAIEDLIAYLKGLYASDEEDLLIALDEIITLRFNRLLRYHGTVDIGLESFYGDYNELVSILPDLAKRDIVMNVIELFKDIIHETKVFVNVNSTTIETIVKDVALTPFEDHSINDVSCTIMPIVKAVFYVGIYSDCAVINSKLLNHEHNIIPKDNNCQAYQILEKLRDASELFQQKNWGVLIIDSKYSKNKQWEIYQDINGDYHILPYYNN